MSERKIRLSVQSHTHGVSVFVVIPTDSLPTEKRRRLIEAFGAVIDAANSELAPVIEMQTLPAPPAEAA